MKPIKVVMHLNIQFYEVENTGEVGKSLSPGLNKENNIKNLTFSLRAQKDISTAINHCNDFLETLKNLVGEFH